MFIIIVVALLIGIWRYRCAEYFKWVGVTFVWMLAGTLLFNGGGTLTNPSGDGLITHKVRVATNDGPMMAVLALAIVIVLWGGIIYFLNRARKAGRARLAANETALDDPDFVAQDDDDITGRKALETVGLLLAAAAWFYLNFTALMSARNPPAAPTKAQTAQAPAPATIEQELMGIAAEVNATTPQQIDPDTILERASASKRTLTYHYKLKGKDTDRDKLRSFILRKVVPKVCSGELRPNMKEHGVSYAYSYTGADFSAPVAVTVDEKTCARLEP